MHNVGVSLLGCGTVGSGVARILLDHRERIAHRVGVNFQLRHVVVRDPSKARSVPDQFLTTDINKVVNDPETSIAVELWGGVDEAFQASTSLLQQGKDLVTANKALLAVRGPELFDTAHELDRAIAFEAAVAGGIPIIAAVGQSFAANQILGITGILNGTSNYILTAMSELGQDYAEALAKAQDLGYAEADPTMDVDGTDAAQKLAILVQVGFGCRVTPEKIHQRGIDDLDLADSRFANDLGYVVKLLAVGRLQDGALELRVAPTLVRYHTPMAEIRGANNAVQAIGDAVGETLFCGAGAGQMPTASAVVADIIDVALGRAAQTFRALRLWSDTDTAPPVRPIEEVRSRYYLRFQVEDRPGVLGRIAQVLGANRISISSFIQPEPGEELTGDVPLVAMTHVATEGDVQKALSEIQEFDVVRAPCVCLPVLG